jgi:hypothetical protein
MSKLNLLMACRDKEFQALVKVIKPIITDPNISRNEKRKTLNGVVNELSENAFKKNDVAEAIIFMINMKEDVCKEFQSVSEQVDGILFWMPRMKYHRDKLEKAVTENRKKYHLENNTKAG